MTAAEERFLEKCRTDGEAWFAPAQTIMVRRLIRRGLLSAICEGSRYNPLRGCHERRVTPKGMSPPLALKGIEETLADASLKRCAWAYGCAKHGSEEEAQLRAVLLRKAATEEP